MLIPRSWYKTALIVVDVQNDFLPGGTLAVPDGDKILPAVKELINSATEAKAIIVYTRDWHPGKSIHFTNWPVHCVQDTPGAELSRELPTPNDNMLISKGQDAEDDDSYSGFDGHNHEGFSLDTILQLNKISNLIICGLATDYCVKETALDGITHGYDVTLIQNACRGVSPDTTDAAMDEMIKFGVEIA